MANCTVTHVGDFLGFLCKKAIVTSIVFSQYTVFPVLRFSDTDCGLRNFVNNHCHQVGRDISTR